MKCDANKFAQMYEQVYKDLYRFALCLMKNRHDAEDAVSEAVISAYENIYKLRKEESFKSWIFTILSNVCKKRLKKAFEECIRYGKTNNALLEEPDYGYTVDVKNAFSVLSCDEQLVVGLSVFGGYNSKEIGHMLKMNPNTVRSKRRRALVKVGYLLQ